MEIGRTLWSPLNLHKVEFSEYAKLLEAIHLLKKIGYRRIGMAIEPIQNQHHNGVYYAAYLLMQQKLSAGQQIPILALDGGWNEKNFARWMRQYQPDVLIVHKVLEICQWLKKLKLKVPRDVSLITTDIRDDDPKIVATLGLKWSGMRRDYFTTGRRAVELVAHLLENGEIGLVGNPSSWQIIGHWESGETLSRPISHLITNEGYLRTAFPRSQA